MQMREEYLKLLGIPNWQCQRSHWIESDESDVSHKQSAYASEPDTDAIIEPINTVDNDLLPAEIVAEKGDRDHLSISEKPDNWSVTGNRVGDDLSPAPLPLNKRITQCQLCQFSKTRHRSILGRGDARSAKIAFITDTPLKTEEAQGKPLAGNAEELFVNVLEAIGLRLEECYITPFIKCRPAELTGVSTKETNACYPFLEEELSAMDPQKPIVLLGRDVTQFLLNDRQPLQKMREKNHTLTIGGVKRTIYATHSPAVLLRMSQLKGDFWRDLKRIAKECNI